VGRELLNTAAEIAARLSRSRYGDLGTKFAGRQPVGPILTRFGAGASVIGSDVLRRQQFGPAPVRALVGPIEAVATQDRRHQGVTRYRGAADLRAELLLRHRYRHDGRPVAPTGRGESCGFDDPGFAEKMKLFPRFERARAVVTVRLTRIADSCGWGVPFFDFKGERDQLRRWVDSRPHDEWAARRYESNAVSIDGLPGLSPPG